uniref:Uncharacterized protein n=1 Tax=Nelumbo nucifera TaxID=4432 RepID=A0A822XUB3_NELNU|nr:TPA_asm: hypothetical protein HUJ06_025045 [Nelumbo nucifera]
MVREEYTEKRIWCDDEVKTQGVMGSGRDLKNLAVSLSPIKRLLLPLSPNPPSSDFFYSLF